MPKFTLVVIDTNGKLVRGTAFPNMPTDAEVYEEHMGKHLSRLPGLPIGQCSLKKL